MVLRLQAALRWCVLAGLAAGLSGCGSLLDSVDGPVPAAGAVQDRQAPAIQSPTLVPATLRYTGGTTTVSAVVTDSGGVARVWAEVSLAGGGLETLELAAGTNGAYAATWTAPANARTDGSGTVHSVRVHARDVAGNEASSAPMSLTVQAPPAPPEGPPF